MLLASASLIGFTQSGGLAVSIGVTRPNRVRLRYGSHTRRARLRGQPCGYDPRSLGYLSKKQLQGWDLSPNQISQAYPGAPDFCEMAAISFSNAVDLTQREAREAEYMKIVKKYDRNEVELFPQALGQVVLALEKNFGDVLGRTFHDLELHNKWAGQFFTPYDVSRMMAKMTIGDGADLRARIAQRGFVTAQEPAVGSGAMVIALAEALREAGLNYQEHLHVRAVDVDLKCVHMAYVQFSLLHIPAIITHGDSLALKEYSHWYTPAHILGEWNEKFQRQAAIEQMFALITAPPLPVVAANPPTVEESSAELPRFPVTQLTLF